MVNAPYEELPPAKRRRLMFRTALRSLLFTTVLVVLTTYCRWTSGSMPVSRCVC